MVRKTTKKGAAASNVYRLYLEIFIVALLLSFQPQLRAVVELPRRENRLQSKTQRGKRREVLDKGGLNTPLFHMTGRTNVNTMGICYGLQCKGAFKQSYAESIGGGGYLGRSDVMWRTRSFYLYAITELLCFRYRFRFRSQ